MPQARILIVEDEALIAMMLEDFIETLGYELAGIVDSVEEGVAAVEKGDFDMAILDLNLRERQASWPIADALNDAGKAFIFTSGADIDAPPERHQGREFLSKPFTLKSVDDAIKRTLESR